jgi:hypothetical protein
MSNHQNDPTGALAGEWQYGFPNGEVEEGKPQRFAGATLPASDETAEAVRTRGARHIELEA